MTHMGYFSWSCTSCGQSGKGDLPERDERLAARDSDPIGRFEKAA